MGIRKLKSDESEKSIQVELDDNAVDLPIIQGTEGEFAIDISKLRSQTGCVTLDPAYVNTASCTSEITFLDGEKGILRYRGYPIEDLANHCNFVEVSHLLINGELPDEQEYVNFEKSLSHASKVEADVIALLRQFPGSAHPMAMLSAALVSLSAIRPDLCGPDLNDSDRSKVIHYTLGQMKGICAAIFRLKQNLNPVLHKDSLNYSADFLNMMFSGTPNDVLDQEIDKALNTLLILHADHEQNCSTSTVRLVGSSKASVFAAISSGVNALWGPLHGGANQAVIEMLEEIDRCGGDYKKFISKAKDKNDPFKLMGFGHRVYKNFDPRAQIIKKSCDTVLEKLGIQDPLLDIAKGLEEEVLKDSYFAERKLYPNVDFYSGIIYKALNIPNSMFTTMFALGRLPGWLAQWQEMISSPTMKIGRPRQIYLGKCGRTFSKKR